MAVYEDQNALIPVRRADLIEICIEDGKLSADQAKTFREFCEILSAYYHFKFHAFVETLKQNYTPFDPTGDQVLRVTSPTDQKRDMAAKLVRAFQTVLESASYKPLSSEQLQKAFDERSLLGVKTEVDFDEMETVMCYYQGDTSRKITFKRFFKRVRTSVTVFDRVALLIKFKDADYFRAKKINPKRLKFIPGKVYVYLYKTIPQFDLEMLFPNVKTSMTWSDRFLFWVPAVGAIVPLVLRVLPQGLLILGIILFFLGFPGLVTWLNVTEDEAREILPTLVAALSMAIAFGSFAFWRYSVYQTKKLWFQKAITDITLFRTIAHNIGVFQFLIDAAEEEECKEIILVYYHLLTSGRRMTVKQLSTYIETWMTEKFNATVDFDIQNPLRNLSLIRGFLTDPSIRIDQAGDPEDSVKSEMALFSYDTEGYCNVLPLRQAKVLLDYVWDHAFTYSNHASK